jgi:tetratricopeptide (TPR) repeat protein
MNLLKYLFACLILISTVGSSVAQSYEEEIGFTFVKAKYLLETDRYDDAVREFNRVINEDPTVEDALALRAYAKYKLSAYIGTKKDILKYIELKGITPEAISLLAKAEYQLTEFDAALNSLTTALMMIEDDAELYEFRASIYMDRDQQYLACQDWEAAVKLGSSKALISAKTNCGYRETLPPSPPVSDINKDDSQDGMYAEDLNEGDLTEVKESDEIISDPEINRVLTTEDPESNMGNQEAPVILTSSIDSISSSEIIVEEPAVDPRLIDESVNSIEIDEDLTLDISGQGLGSRMLLKQPNILILSDEDGEVVIDICVSRGGRVVTATFNQSESTLGRKSLVSLAIRKAKDFWFEKSDLREQCGVMRFKIKGT